MIEELLREREVKAQERMAKALESIAGSMEKIVMSIDEALGKKLSKPPWRLDE